MHITVAEYDPRWPELYRREAERIRAALGPRVLLMEHTGSTSVPGLAAKPVIDILLAVSDSADEPAYLTALTGAGYTLRFREPEWFEHRLLKGPDTEVNLHVFSAGCPEIAKVLLLRDWLRTHRPTATCTRAPSSRSHSANGNRWTHTPTPKPRSSPTS